MTPSHPPPDEETLQALHQAVLGPRGLDLTLYYQYLRREYWGSVALEEDFPQGSGKLK